MRSQNDSRVMCDLPFRSEVPYASTTSRIIPLSWLLCLPHKQLATSKMRGSLWQRRAPQRAVSSSSRALTTVLLPPHRMLLLSSQQHSQRLGQLQSSRTCCSAASCCVAPLLSPRHNSTLLAVVSACPRLIERQSSSTWDEDLYASMHAQELDP